MNAKHTALHILRSGTADGLRIAGLILLIMVPLSLAVQFLAPGPSG
jgi:hypothetical protein